LAEDFLMNYRLAKFNGVGGIDCEIEHPVYGWIPYTATEDDPEESGRALYATMLAGTVAAYVPPVETLDQRAAAVRAQRDALLRASDWTQLPDVPESIRAPHTAYRQALRDIPEQAGFPMSVVWPEKP
jgi:hypothetical protein